MSAVKLASVSILALGVTLGPPAWAQQTTGSAPSAVPGAASGTGHGMQRSDIKDKLDQVGVKDRKEFKGHLARAQSPEGHPVLLVFGPEDMKADKSVDNFSQDKVRGKLTQAGFSNINFIQDAQMVRGQLKDDQQILALTAKSANWQPSSAQAQSQTPNLDRLQKTLDQAGLSDGDEFKGKLLQARAANGDALLILIGSKEFEADKSVNLSAEDLNKFQQQGFQTVDVAQRVKMVHGKMDKADVIALSGSDIMGGPASATTGSGASSGSGMGTTSPGTTGSPGSTR